MKKNKIARIIVIVILIALIAASLILYLVDIILNNTPPTKNLLKTLVPIFICIGSLVRLFVRQGRRNLAYYESCYYEDIGNAFASSPFYRKKLLSAIRIYNENKFGKALKLLGELKKVSETRDDLYAVGLFTGLVLTDMGFENDAVAVYNALINMNITSATVYGNLGSIYSGMGKYDDAIAAMRLAIQNDEKNPASYNNLANLYFDTYDLENAKKYALKALEINHKFRPSASLLAIIYSCEKDKENAEKYFHIAISAGQDPEKLQRAIKLYQSKPTEDTKADDEDF